MFCEFGEHAKFIYLDPVIKTTEARIDLAGVLKWYKKYFMSCNLIC